MAIIIRRSIKDLEKEHYAAIRDGSKTPTELQKVVLAWKAIQELEPDDFNSFFTIGGYHGEPFRGAGWANPQWWGGYCAHGNILFPTWHRGYLWRLEKALQDVSNDPSIALPFWDETDENITETDSVPMIFGLRKFQKVDGTEIDNPLFSYKLPEYIFDQNGKDDQSGADYSKPKGYETVRYPLNGIVMDPNSVAHNARYKDDQKNWKILNKNVYRWLTKTTMVADDKEFRTGTRFSYWKSLEAPNYVVFSNATSATQWNDNVWGELEWAMKTENKLAYPQLEMSLERPHGDIHLAVGGFDVPSESRSHIPGANGDMGENDTAALDPLFFFHHCHVDRMFWLWQKHHHQTEHIHIPEKLRKFPGTNSVDAQGPTPGMAANIWLDLDSPLDPFFKGMMDNGMPLTSKDVINIQKIGYDYGPGSLPPHWSSGKTNGNNQKPTVALSDPASAQPAVLRVAGINRAQIAGSFVISAWKQNDDGTESLLGHEAIFSRWRVNGCLNCTSHLGVKSHMPVNHSDEDSVVVKVHTHAFPHGREHEGVTKKIVNW